MFNSTERTTDTAWRHRRLRLTILYLVIALILLCLSGVGNIRLLNQVGLTFGGFFWGIDTDRQVVVVSTPPQLLPFGVSPASLTSLDHIVEVNGQPASELSKVYQHARPGDLITYTVQQNGKLATIISPAVTFTWDMWFELWAGIYRGSMLVTRRFYSTCQGT